MWFSPALEALGLSRISLFGMRSGSTWRYPDAPPSSIAPNYKPSLTHHSHQRACPRAIYGIQAGSRLRVIDNSDLGRRAMAERKPPKVIQVQAPFHRRKPHGAIGKLGDRVSLAIMGEVRHGVIVGLKVKQYGTTPRFDSNNVILIDRTGAPIGTRIHAPIPIALKKILKDKTVAKKVDYTKILSIASRFV